MKSLILMGFAACVVLPMTWTVDAQVLCQTKDCRDNVALRKRESNQRIVGGSNTAYGDYPYICSLKFREGSKWVHWCGCVIWDKNYVVTAAHCLRYGASQYRVVVGEYAVNQSDSHQVNHTIYRYTRHPAFKYDISKGLPNDIAIIKMKTPIAFNDKVKKATFASRDSLVEENCVLVGWGYDSESKRYPNILQSVNMTALSKSKCKTLWVFSTILDGNICFHKQAGMSSCFGDSGGPAICGQYITGISSWTEGLCSGERPSVYTRVSHYYDWLVSVTGSN